MGVGVLIIGASGTGKTTSLRNFKKNCNYSAASFIKKTNMVYQYAWEGKKRLKSRA
jgi:ABC-type phosphate/phosphonate transport system ATPase subunit